MEVALGVVGVLLVLVLVIVAIAAGKPDEMVVTRKAHLGAPPEHVFSLLHDFREWPKWSPWEELDPEMRRTHSGQDRGVGAIYEWTGNKKVGQGRMEITEAHEPKKVVIDLHFIAPWEARNMITFNLTPVNEETEVEWRMDGKRPLMMKVMSLFMNMDDLVGKDFEKGLSKLKTVTERDQAT